MADADERKRILDMLSEGKITAADAAALLAALGGGGRAGPIAGPPPRPPRPARTGAARTFRVSIDALDDADERARIRVNIPLGLARFASRFLPPEARAHLDAQGIDLEGLIESIGDDVPDGQLVDIDVDAPDGTKKARIVIEVA